MKKIRRSYCGLCHPRCGTLLHIENGKVVKVSGDPDHPITRGAICERGRLMPDHIYHPQRLNYPLKRVGKKGDGRWQRLTWDQALDEVADKLSGLRDKYGAETLTFTHGTKRTFHWDCRRFFNLFGSPNTCGVNTICMCPSYATEYATYGGMVLGSEVPAAKCIVLWGCNASQSSPISLYPQLVHARKNGAKLIVIDPRRIKADIIKKHMWPLTVIPPRHMESLVVSLVDTFCSARDYLSMKKQDKPTEAASRCVHPEPGDEKR